MSETPPTGGEAATTPPPTPSERLSGAADEILHDAQRLLDKAGEAADAAIDRLDDASDAARERATQAAESVIDELRGIGSRLAAALQAAASTPEAEGLKNDIREGAQRLVSELQTAIKASPIAKIGGRGDAPATDAAADAPDVAAASGPAPSQRVASTVRTELANALRGLNRALDKLAGQLAPDAAASTAAKPDDAPPA